MTGVTFSTFTKLRNNQEVAISILMRIAEALACNLGDMMDFVKDDRTTLYII